MPDDGAASTYGWHIDRGQSARGRPQVMLTKPHRAAVIVQGETGIDVAILLERALPDALAQDVAASSLDDRALWETRHNAVQASRDVARAARLAARTVAGG